MNDLESNAADIDNQTIVSETNRTNKASVTESVLDMVRLNSINSSDYHGYKYLWLKRTLYCYRVPIIIISACSAFIGSSSQPYLGQTTITTITTVLSLVVGIITSLELFFNVQSNMEAERKSHKDYYALSVDILEKLMAYRQKNITNNVASIDPDLNTNTDTLVVSNANTNDELTTFTEETFKQYMRINRASSVIEDEFEDILSPACPLVYPLVNTNQTASTDQPLSIQTNQFRKICRPRQHRIQLQRQQILNGGMSLRQNICQIPATGSPSRIYPSSGAFFDTTEPEPE